MSSTILYELMRTDTGEKILRYIQQHRQVRPKELREVFSISNQALHKQLVKLVSRAQITKTGTPPHVFYLPVDTVQVQKDPLSPALSSPTAHLIEKNFLYITAAGKKYQGVTGFAEWCKERGFDMEQKSQEYRKIIEKYRHVKKNGLIDATSKIKSSLGKTYLDYLYYIDFYSIEIFGKTRLGQLLLFAKQSQDKALMREIIHDIAPHIQRLIKLRRIEAVGFIPPTVKRNVQFMRELEKRLALSLPKIPLLKVRSDIVVPQKSLSKIADRIENAKNTIMVDQSRSYKNILLIDDAAGSGASLNETAAKLKEKKIAQKKVIGLALVGSLKGFEVISEV